MKKFKFLLSFLIGLSLTFPLQLHAQDWTTISGSPFDNGAEGHTDVWFINENTGWITGSEGIKKTTNGGVNWITQLPFEDITSISITDSLNGWATTWGFNFVPSLYKTTNGGTNWIGITNIPSPGIDGLSGINTLGLEVITATGYDNGTPRFIRSTNGGTNWICKDLSAYASSLGDCHFFNKDSGVVTGYKEGKAVIVGTIDGGITWTPRYTSTIITSRPGKLSFKGNIGYSTSQNGINFHPSFFLKTTDGGINWFEITYQPSSSLLYDIKGIGFLTPKIGWVGRAGSNYIFETTDGGSSWHHVSFGNKMNRMRFLNDSIGYAAGTRIYKFARTFLLSGDPSGQVIPGEYSLEQNYPNPFNPSTMINYQLPISNNVRLNIYDVNGRLVKALVNEKQHAGTHSITFDGAGLPSGVYFYKLEAGEYRETRKMLLIK